MPERMNPNEVKRRVQNDDALLVCAYDDAEKCRSFGIQEAIPYPELKPRLNSVPKSRELVFFCA